MADVSEYTAVETPDVVSSDQAPATTTPETTNKFQHAISAWRSKLPHGRTW
jgi:hypothetical protein